MSKREFLMLANEYDPEKHGISGSFWSEKLDGIRAFWDGGLSRGLLKRDVPWANTNKDDRYKEEQYATGLWSRYGNVIHAPDWWLNLLPAIPTDGELWIGRTRGDRQRCKSITGTIKPDETAWGEVKYRIFNSPPLESIFEDGRINNTNFIKNLTGCMNFVHARMKSNPLAWSASRAVAFSSMLKVITRYIPDEEGLIGVLKQTQLPFNEVEAREIITETTEYVESIGGEGLIVMAPYGLWAPERVKYLLKIKKLADAEAVVVGYTAGEETDKGSKLLGLMGAAIVNWNGVTFKLSGFTEAERELAVTRTSFRDDELKNGDATQWAEEHPGENVPQWIEAVNFPRGTKVTFKYRGLTKDGIPNEARYWRPA